MTEARATPTIKEANAMSVATVNSRGHVHARVVLCKSWSAEGFVFYTNYESQKGQDLAQNPNAAAVFYWDPLFKQVKVSGEMNKTSRETSVAYWDSRARDSQLSQYISRQSQPAPSREQLERDWAAADAQFKDRPVPCPEHWGGYRLNPRSIEFWVGRHGRLHDRHVFSRPGADQSWTYTRLYP